MRLKKTSPAITIVVLFMAIGFSVWGISLIVSVNQQQRTVQKYVAVITEFSNLERSIRDLEKEALSGIINFQADSAKSIWQKKYSAYRTSRQAIIETENIFAGDIKEKIAAIDASMENVNAIYTKELLPNAQSIKLNQAQMTFHNETAAAISQIKEIVSGIRSQLGKISMMLAKKWQYLNILVFISCFLAISLSIVLYTYQRNSSRQKRTEKALYRITAEFRAIFKSIPDAVVFTDMNNEIIMVNPAFSVLFGYKPEEVIGQQVNILFDEKAIKNAHNGKSLYFEAEKSFKPYEIDCLRKNRSTFISETVTTAVNDDRDQPFGIFSIIRDVTKRKTAEKALSEAHDKLEVWVNERTRDLVRANEEIRRFAYIVSHDLRAPLVNIKGFSSELREAFGALNSKLSDAIAFLPEENKEEISDILQEEIPEALQFIDSSATRMSSLIDAVLKLSRLGRRELHFEGINVRVIIQKILDSMAHQIEQRNVQINIGTLPRVIADRTSLEQIFGNILGNAIKYLVSERPGKIDIFGEHNRSETVFHIRDNGQGIAEEYIDKIFEPFSRFGNDDVPGEGMGLAYVLKLVRRHGGYIKCESELGKGTTISFSLSNTAIDEAEKAEAE